MPVTEETSLATRPFRGLRNASLTLITALLTTAVLWCGWAWIAHRRLQARMDAIAALHQPFAPADFAKPAVADGENAAVLWKGVFAVLPSDTKAPSASNLQFNDYPPYPPAWHQLEDQSVVLNRNVLALAHTAAAAPQCDWGNPASTAYSSLNYYNQARATADVLADAALHAHLHGDDALALQRVSDLFKLARCVGKDGTVIGRLVSVGILSVCTDRLMAIAPDLKIDSDRASVESLIRSLADETDESRCRTLAVDAERLNTHQMMDGERHSRWLLGPLIDLSEAHLLDQRAIDRAAAEAGNRVDVEKVYKSNQSVFHAPAASAASSAHAMAIRWDTVYDDPSYSLNGYFNVEWQAAADRRCAAIALAIQLYRFDHGRWPAAASELAPEYLSNLPADPFSPDGSPIGYIIRKNALPDASDRPMLYYNLGVNPQTCTLPAAPTFCLISRGWQWRDLSRWYPAPASVGTQSYHFNSPPNAPKR